MFELNPSQKEAVTYFDTPLLIVAGAGSGKTMVITHKIAYLVKNNLANPENILAITFTNKAAREMKERVTSLLDDNLKNRPFISTFHAFCSYVLRKEFHALNRDPNFTIYDVSDQKQIINQVFETLKMDPNKVHPKKVQNLISTLKNDLISPEEYFKRKDQYYFEEDIAKMYEHYQKMLLQNNAIDFDDLLFYVVKLFSDRKDILEKYQDQFKYILIDEYQDTNLAQYQLAKYFAEKNKKITAVGDFDQNIYTWRGADIKNILNFEKDYPNAKTILLEQNYRSTKTILKTANKLIKSNQLRKDKNLWTENQEGENVNYFLSYNEYEEMEYVVKEIHKLCKTNQLTHNDIVVLYRTNAQSRVIEDVFSKNNINYRLVGGIGFYKRKEIKDITAYLRLVANIHDNYAFFRVINQPLRGIGQTSIKKMQNLAETQVNSIYNLSLQNNLPVSKEQFKKITDFFDLINSLKDTYEQDTENKLANLIKNTLMKSGIQKDFETENSLDSLERLENIQELITIAKENNLELTEFLNNIALISDLDETKESGNAVTLMTLHNAKGLEFDVVFLVGLEEGLLPHYKTLFDEKNIEEERRLCYVGITRAKKLLYLSSANKRSIFGEVWHNDFSRFLKELPRETVVCSISEQLIKLDEDIIKKLRENGIHYEIISTSDEKKEPSVLVNLNEGDLVEHKIWGRGHVLTVKGTGADLQVKVAFSDEVRNLMLKYAPLVKINQ
ncbi:MAG: UvrD-helicase domain-containing protein [Candidatus Margulisiibacteriota bacterium]|jgi:DNA helicase-2/ATP-dependent DNA helicase PcrA